MCPAGVSSPNITQPIPDSSIFWGTPVVHNPKASRDKYDQWWPALTSYTMWGWWLTQWVAQEWLDNQIYLQLKNAAWPCDRWAYLGTLGCHCSFEEPPGPEQHHSFVHNCPSCPRFCQLQIWLLYTFVYQRLNISGFLSMFPVVFLSRMLLALQCSPFTTSLLDKWKPANERS